MHAGACALEDPIAFDLWVAFGPGLEFEARQLLQKANPEMSPAALLKTTREPQGVNGFPSWRSLVGKKSRRGKQRRIEAEQPRCTNPAMDPRTTSDFTDAQSTVCATQGASDVRYAVDGLVGSSAAIPAPRERIEEVAEGLPRRRDRRLRARAPTNVGSTASRARGGPRSPRPTQVARPSSTLRSP